MGETSAISQLSIMLQAFGSFANSTFKVRINSSDRYLDTALLNRKSASVRK